MDTSQPFTLSICARCNAPVLSSLVASHRTSCYKNVRPPSPNLIRKRQASSTPTDDGLHHSSTKEAPPRSMLLLYVGSEGFADEYYDDSTPHYRGGSYHHTGVPHRNMEAGDAAALYNNISLHRSDDPAPSSIRSMADSIDELELTARPAPGTTSPSPLGGDDDEPPHTSSYAHIASVSPTRSSALRSFVDAATENDEGDGPRLEEYPTDWDTVLEEGSPERERLTCSRQNNNTSSPLLGSPIHSSSSTTREMLPSQRPPSLSDGFDRQFKAPSFAIASAALNSDQRSQHTHQQGGVRDVFLPYLHNRPRGESTAIKGAPLNHRPFMLVGKATVSRRDWGSDQTDQGALSKRRPTGGSSQVAARPSSAGPPSRGASSNNRRSSHKPAAPRMSATGATPLRPYNATIGQPQRHSNPTPKQHEDIVVPETARALLHTSDELDATFQEEESQAESAVATQYPQQFKAINIRGTSGAGKVIIHRPAMLLSPRKAPPTSQTAPIQDATWTSREVKQSAITSTTPTVAAAEIVPPPTKEANAPTPRVAAVRGSSAHSRFVFPPSLRAIHPQVASKRPSSVGPKKGSGTNTRGANVGAVYSKPQSSHSISPEPVPPAIHQL